MKHATLLATVVLLIFLGTTMAEEVCKYEQLTERQIETPPLRSDALDTYTGTIRVYVAEIVSRWNDNDNIPFHNTMLTFALETPISINETDSLTWDLNWNGNDYTDNGGFSFGDLEEGNTIVTAAVYNPNGYQGYSYPGPSEGPFNVYEVDACASAIPGMTGYNILPTGFTHSFLIDDASTTW